MPEDSREQCFQALFDASFDDLTRFVRRRIRDGDDIVAETYLVGRIVLGLKGVASALLESGPAETYSSVCRAVESAHVPPATPAAVAATWRRSERAHAL